MSDVLTAAAAAVFNVSEAEINDGLAFNAIKSWDSVNHINLMLALEETFEMTIPDDDIIELTSIGAIRRYLAGRGITTTNSATP